ncbi:hypothetical protein N7457_005724 [Penicillium paradoxum]|uniref:uncharacterized protein n=1 Tax=Penicillium paradoxum TaxID=176176 RepID=UPI0025487113|nr:uncharacterized protein N7457_005724 [Penicillium paradoxum]KAJ5780564.1 hypothetical protein N7457_005724 [Penicillium paradoxum]
MLKPSPPLSSSKNPIQTEQVYDNESEAGNALAGNQMLEHFIWGDLEGLEDEDLHPQRHFKKQGFNAQREMFEEVTKSIRGSFGTIHSTDFVPSRFLASSPTKSRKL